MPGKEPEGTFIRTDRDDYTMSLDDNNNDNESSSTDDNNNNEQPQIVQEDDAVNDGRTISIIATPEFVVDPRSSNDDTSSAATGTTNTLYTATTTATHTLPPSSLDYKDQVRDHRDVVATVTTVNSQQSSNNNQTNRQQQHRSIPVIIDHVNGGFQPSIVPSLPTIASADHHTSNNHHHRHGVPSYKDQVYNPSIRDSNPGVNTDNIINTNTLQTNISGVTHTTGTGTGNTGPSYKDQVYNPAENNNNNNNTIRNSSSELRMSSNASPRGATTNTNQNLIITEVPFADALVMVDEEDGGDNTTTTNNNNNNDSATQNQTNPIISVPDDNIVHNSMNTNNSSLTNSSQNNRTTRTDKVNKNTLLIVEETRKIQKNIRMLWTILLVILVVGVVIGGTCAAGVCRPNKNNNNDSDDKDSKNNDNNNVVSPPTASPTFDPAFRISTITEFINNITLINVDKSIDDDNITIIQYYPTVDKNYEDYESTKHLLSEELALQWIIDKDDPIQEYYNIYTNTINTDKIIKLRQRYTLATIYYQQPDIINDPWRDQSSWLLPNTDECTWFAIVCNSNNIIIEIRLGRILTNNVKGRIPDDIGLLSNIQYFDIRNNYFTGTIPSTIGTYMKNTLRYFNIGGNLLTGTIPESFGQLTKIEEFHTLSVHGLTGSIPESIGEQWMNNIKFFNIADCNFNSTIPTTISLWNNIEIFYIYSNTFTGTIPIITNWINVTEILLFDNKFIGNIPCFINSPNLIRLESDCFTTTLNCTCCTECY